MHTVELLVNGYMLITDRSSGLRGLYVHGFYRSGDLKLDLFTATSIIHNWYGS